MKFPIEEVSRFLRWEDKPYFTTIEDQFSLYVRQSNDQELINFWATRTASDVNKIVTIANAYERLIEAQGRLNRAQKEFDGLMKYVD